MPHRRLLFSTFLICALMGVITLGQTEPPVSSIKSDEDIQLYPTYGVLDVATGNWTATLRGKVFEPEESSTKRRILLALIRGSVGKGMEIPDSDLFDSRLRPFLVDNERGKSVTVEIARQRFAAGTSEKNGHFSSECRFRSPLKPSVEPAAVEIKAVLPAEDRRDFRSQLHLIPPSGVSLISDIDDTIKDSNVRDRTELIKNTFFRPFHSVDGMADVYRQLASTGVAFHYVSGSPWQLFDALQGFLVDFGFPPGTMHLKHFRLTDKSSLGLFASQVETKLGAIEPLLQDFPKRRFLLVGDSGEQDPEIYGRIARKYPEQVIGVFIHNVTGESAEDNRFTEAFSQVSSDRWLLFEDVGSMKKRLGEIQALSR